MVLTGCHSDLVIDFVTFLMIELVKMDSLNAET